MADNKGLTQILKINMIVLFGGFALFALVTLLPGQRDAGDFAGLMIFFNVAGVAVNLVAAVVFAVLRQWSRVLGAIIGSVLFALIGFGLCLGGMILLESLGASPMSFH